MLSANNVDLQRHGMDEINPMDQQAWQALHQRLTAVEVAQQLFAVHLRELEPDAAKRVAVALENLATSNKLDADAHVKAYLGHLARLLSAMGYPIVGLNKPPLDAGPATWLKAFTYDVD